ncbi:hypothetical protein Btru_055033 [Bulinus truncatus]|nr:hypothetical protein Btru_055033 [Bulinus truncatus]
MPAGTSWSRYLTAGLTSLLFMFAGAQSVHMIYKPLEDLDSRIQHEVQKRKLGKENLKEKSIPVSSNST